MRKLLILTALPQEENALINAFDSAEILSKTYGNRLQIKAKILNLLKTKIILAQTGVGSVNAAITLASICENEDIDDIVLLGVGGALSEKLQIGDLVISTGVIQHDSFASLETGNLSMRAGSFLLTKDDPRAREHFIPAEPRLVEELSKINFKKHRTLKGVVLSGGEFVGTTNRKSAIAKLHPDALLVDMEAAGVAQLATQLKIPFVVAKTVSDRLLPDGSIENDFVKFLEAAAKNAAALMKEMLKD